jgi:hypothetical protein
MPLSSFSVDLVPELHSSTKVVLGALRRTIQLSCGVIGVCSLPR